LVTDYPAPAVMDTLRTNVARNIQAELCHPSARPPPANVVIEGHEWGTPLDGALEAWRHSVDRLFAADCLWMPWQHAALRRTAGELLRRDSQARFWVVAGFHTGRAKMRGFFDAGALRSDAGLEVERIWERDCDGRERPWVAEQDEEDITIRKRWLVVAVLRRIIDDKGEVM
jgi:nicotinamide N-methyltransferase